MTRNRILAIVGTLGLSLAIGVMSLAASDDVNKTPAKPAAAAAKQNTSPPASSQGVRVFIDPVTGKIREPEPEELRQLTPAAPGVARRSMAPLAAPLQGPGGAIGMVLDDSQMVYSVAKKNADGTISFECVTGAADAAKTLSSKPAERSQSDVK